VPPVSVPQAERTGRPPRLAEPHGMLRIGQGPWTRQGWKGHLQRQRAAWVIAETYGYFAELSKLYVRRAIERMHLVKGPAALGKLRGNWGAKPRWRALFRVCDRSSPLTFCQLSGVRTPRRSVWLGMVRRRSTV
jgi:hypothetical protein